MTANKSVLKRVYDFLKGRHINPNELSNSDRKYLEVLNQRVDGQEPIPESGLIDSLYNFELPSMADDYYEHILSDSELTPPLTAYVVFLSVIDILAVVPEALSASLSDRYNTYCESRYIRNLNRSK